MNTRLTRQRILIRLSWDGHRITGVEITSGRLPHLTDLFEGRGEQDVLAMLPRLFTLCGNAHSIAARHAFALASGNTPAVTPREILTLLLENLRESLFRILLTWGSPDADGAARLTRPAGALLARVSGAPAQVDLKRIRKDLERLRANVEREILGEDAADFLARDENALLAWMTRGATPAARFLGTTLTCALAETAIPPPLGREDLPKVEKALDSREWRDYVLHPHVAGVPRHTAPGDRRACRLPAPCGLFVRRLAALADTLHRLTRLPDDPHPATPLPAGGSMACVETARGWLIHKVLLESGKVRAYRILAPTEWNFHPRGIAYRLLKAIEGRDETRIARLAGWLVLAIDPCVDHKIELEAVHA